MDNKEQIIKHLEIIQGVINRLAHNSFLIKGWSMTILAAAMLFLSRAEYQSQYIILCLLVPVAAFWVLDGYFLWQERLFRGVYNDVRKQEETDFAMNIPAQMNKPNNKWRNATISLTLCLFYIAEAVFVISIFFILQPC